MQAPPSHFAQVLTSSGSAVMDRRDIPAGYISSFCQPMPTMVDSPLQQRVQLEPVSLTDEDFISILDLEAGPSVPKVTATILESAGLVDEDGISILELEDVITGNIYSAQSSTVSLLLFEDEVFALLQRVDSGQVFPDVDQLFDYGNHCSSGEQAPTTSALISEYQSPQQQASGPPLDDTTWIAQTYLTYASFMPEILYEVVEPAEIVEPDDTSLPSPESEPSQALINFSFDDVSCPELRAELLAAIAAVQGQTDPDAYLAEVVIFTRPGRSRRMDVARPVVVRRPRRRSRLGAWFAKLRARMSSR